MKLLSLTVTTEQENLRVQDVLRDVYDVSESYLSKLKRRPGALLKNGEPVYTTSKVQAGDTVSFDPGDPEKLPIPKIPYPLSIVREDEWLLVLDKPAGMSVHPARDPDEPTVENALASYFTGTDNPHPVSRLDKGTTGLLTVANGALSKDVSCACCGRSEGSALYDRRAARTGARLYLSAMRTCRRGGGEKHMRSAESRGWDVACEAHAVHGAHASASRAYGVHGLSAARRLALR